MTHSLKVLLDRGFISVGPNPDDARGKLVHLTEAGRAFRDEAIARVVREFSDLFEPDHLAAMETLRPGLRAIRQYLDANRR